MRSNIQERSKSTLKKTTYPVQKAINENKIKQYLKHASAGNNFRTLTFAIFKQSLAQLLKNNFSYPKRLQSELNQYCKHEHDQDTIVERKKIVMHPNEYNVETNQSSLDRTAQSARFRLVR